MSWSKLDRSTRARSRPHSFLLDWIDEGEVRSHEGSAMYPPNTAIPIFLHLLSPQSIKPNKKIQQTNIEMEHLSKPPPGAPRKSNHPPRIILSPVVAINCRIDSMVMGRNNSPTYSTSPSYILNIIGEEEEHQ
jgi:hypothetical protein|mmetsp:Transcript_16955/g.33941  ORF Transcript_16955/g.33941 Transcript_16955/m.33941 type:complete len:133 (-) Transcript_16955:1611-2009(-)